MVVNMATRQKGLGSAGIGGGSFLVTPVFEDIQTFEDTTAPYGNAITAGVTVNAGDILVLTERMTITSGGSATPAPPTGFTDFGGVYKSSEFICMTLSVKIADGTEGGTSIATGITGITNQGGYEAMLLRYSAGASSVTAGGLGQADNTGGSFITAGSGTSPQLVLSLVGVRTSRSVTSHTVGGAGTLYNSIDNSHSLNVLIQETASDVSSSYSAFGLEEELYGYAELT